MVDIKDCERIAERMFCEVMDNAKDFEPDTTDYESLFEKHFEAVMGDIPMKVFYEYQYMAAYNSKPVQEIIEEIVTYVREYWEDHRRLNENPMQYYGLKQSDFI